MTTINVDIEVELDEFSDEDIKKEAKARGLLDEEDTEGGIVEMFYAFKLGKEDRAIELARKIAQDYTGMIL
jgi:hypothetical protein